MPVSIHIPTPLRPFTEKLDIVQASGATVGEVLRDLTTRYSGLRQHLYAPDGRLRSFVNIYVGDDDIRYLQKEQTPVVDGQTLSIIPSVAGGVGRVAAALPALVEAAGENAQSRFVAQKMLELREEGVPLSEIAVLFRSSFHSFDLEIELSRCGLPFVKRGGIKFIEAAHVKDLLAHLRVVVNPQDAVSWHRVLMLVEGVGPKKAHDLVAAMVRVNDPYQVLRDSSGRSGKQLKELALVLDSLSKSDDLSPTEQVNRVYEYYLPILKDHHDDYPKRIRDLDHLHTIAESYPSLAEFLADLALAPPDGSAVGVEPAGRDDEQVVLSTIHSAKGLEWQCVFLLWVVDGKFPSVFSFNTDEELEEERRLLYVAVTRAKRYLFLIYPINVYDRSSGMLLSKPSRFLDHVSPRLFETLALVEEGHGHEWGHEHDRYV